MKQRLIVLLKMLIAWLEGPQATAALDEAAMLLVTAQEQHEGRSGEAKRHQVLSSLMKQFPDTRVLELSKAIDRAVERHQ